MLKFYPQIDEKHVHVVYNGVSDMFFPLDKKESTDSFIKESLLFVGSRDFYKNFEKGVKALAGTNFNLIIIGGGKLSELELLLLNNSLGENRYRKYDYISTEDLNVLYNNARGLLYPSIYEGFGIPVLEAQKAGLPVIAFNGSSIPEV